MSFPIFPVYKEQIKALRVYSCDDDPLQLCRPSPNWPQIDYEKCVENCVAKSGKGFVYCNGLCKTEEGLKQYGPNACEPVKPDLPTS